MAKVRSDIPGLKPAILVDGFTRLKPGAPTVMQLSVENQNGTELCAMNMGLHIPGLKPAILVHGFTRLKPGVPAVLHLFGAESNWDGVMCYEHGSSHTRAKARNSSTWIHPAKAGCPLGHATVRCRVTMGRGGGRFTFH